MIAIIVSPLDCSSCHEQEYLEQKGSHYAKTGQILGSLDNLLGEVVGGPPAVNAGCRPMPRLRGTHRPGGATHPGQLAQHGHGQDQPRRFMGLLLGLSRPPRVFRGTGPSARGLRQVSPRSGPSADGGLGGVQARHPLPSKSREAQPRQGRVACRQGLLQRPDLLVLSHERRG
jgi:hypothetical protein